MKLYFRQTYQNIPIEDELTVFDLRDSIEKTRQALEIAYAGFDYAVEPDLIDSYIYQMNALQRRYKHLQELAEAKAAATEAAPAPEPARLRMPIPIRFLARHGVG